MRSGMLTLGAIANLVVGALIGGYANAWLQRAKPAVQIASITVGKAKAEGDILIPVDEDMRALTRESNWLKSLPQQVSVVQLGESEKEARELLDSLDSLTRWLRKVDAALGKPDAQQQYVNLARNAGADVLATFSGSIEGMCRRAEVAFPDFNPLTIATLGGEEMPIREFKASFEEKGELLSDKKLKAFAITLGWFPEQLRLAVSAALKDATTETTLIRSALEKMAAMRSAALANVEKEQVSVDAYLTNGGGTAITLDKYAALSVSGFEAPLLVVAQEVVGGVALPPGESKLLHYTSYEQLTDKNAKALHALYDTDVIKCRMTTRAIARPKFASEWVASPAASLGGYSKRLEDDYKTHAAVP